MSVDEGVFEKKDWSNRYNYPLRDSDDLPKIAQFMAIDHFDMFPKYRISEEFQNKDQPNFFKEDEPHGILADLNLPVLLHHSVSSFTRIGF
jgi:hypothetical protein